MGVRITTGNESALYDSVTGRAFGLVFEDHIEAQAFLDWLQRDRGIEDARSLSAAALLEEHDRWTHVRYGE